MSYGLSIADDRGGMVEIDSLPWIPHAFVQFVRINKAGTHKVKIEPATNGRRLHVAPCGGGDYDTGFGIHPHKYKFDLGGSATFIHSIQSFSITPDGWLTIVIRRHNNGGITTNMASLEVWQGY